MKISEKLRMRPMALVLAAIGLALLLVTALTLSLSARAGSTDGGLEVNKWVNVDQAEPGDALTYTIHIVHNAPDATLWMTDTLPPGLTYVDGSLHKNAVGPGSLGYANGVVTWTASSFGYGNWVYITFTAEISPDLVAMTIVNTAEVTGTGTLVPASASTQVSSGELQVSKEAADQASPGDTLTYTVHIAHQGAVSTLWMTDTLPSGLTYVDGSLQKYGPGSADYADGVVTWTASGFGAGNWVYITFTAEISPDITAATVVNTATISGPGISTSVSASTALLPVELQVSKEASASSIRPDEQLGYTIRISNTGEGIASAVSMVDPLPPEVSYASGLSATGGSGASWGVSGDVVTWTGRLDPSEEATIDFTVDISSTLSEGTYFTNVVTVTGAGRLISDSVEAMVRINYDYYMPMMYRNYPPVPVLDPIPAHQETFTATWDCQGCETVADRFVLQEATDAGFTQNVQGYTTTQTFFPVDKTGVHGVFYYRVRADDGWGQGPWSNVVLVNTSPPEVSLDPIPAYQETFTVTWDCQGCETVADHFVLQEATDAGFTQNLQEFTTAQTLFPMNKTGIYGVFYYRVRADDGWGQGPWSNVVLANLSPPGVSLNDIPIPDIIPGVGVQPYMVTWDCSGCEAVADQFVIQQSTGDDFTSNVVEYTAAGTSLLVDNGGIMDNLYYRVRADGGWGQGPWSNVKMVNIPFYDNFDNSNSGWPNEEGVMYIDGDGKRHEWKRDYKDYEYRLKVEQGGPLAWFWQPAAWAPYKPYGDEYCIETNVKFAEGNFSANMGVIFGSADNDEDETQIYAMCLARDDAAGLGWFLMRKDDYQFPSDVVDKRGGCARPTKKIEGADIVPAGEDVRAGTSRDGWNRLRIGVDGDNVRIYIGDHYKGRTSMSGLSGMKYVGVIGGDYELTPIDVRYEYFQVIPEWDCN